ncbi:hypothetical protein TEK04_09205 [Klenkia sp. LSe6-5]|uniref:Pilus assembly protein CpaB n=1 Tax=Klenkia sesuvii TaxID=3103137 RepID=A0ABU8DTB4_9ACTN
MNRRLVAAVVAVLVAAGGVWVVLGYARGADARAQAAETLTPVLVVTAQVPAGTPAEDLSASVTTAQVPARLVADGAVTDLSAVSGLSTTAELLPGELLQTGRFGDPDATRADGSRPAPEGTEEISLTLERQRAAGGTLVPGDLAGVFGTASTINDGPDVAVELDGVLVTRVFAPADPDGVWTVTLALSPTAAAAVSAAQADGTVYLSLQAPGTATAERFSGDGTALSGGSSAPSPSDTSATSGATS